MAKRKKPIKGRRQLTAPMRYLFMRNDAKIRADLEHWEKFAKRMRRRGFSISEAADIYYNHKGIPPSDYKHAAYDPYFHYPTLNVGDHPFQTTPQDFKRNQDSLLSTVGYSYSSTNNFALASNRDLLEYAIRVELVGNLARFFPEWGHPLSPTRLKKIAWTMASVIKDAKRRGEPKKSGFLKYWTADFYYLKDKYYDDENKRMFHWPNIDD